MGPLITQGIINPEWNPIFAFLIGLGFGYALEQGGFSSSRKLVGVFYGYDMITLRVFLTAVLTASIGLLYFNYVGWIDLSMIYINPTFLWSAIVGGALIGLGIIVGGFCPGTSMVAASIGKIDGMAFVGGIFLGVFFYAETYPWLWESLHNATPMGKIMIYDSLGMEPGTFIFLFTVVSLIIFWLTIFIKRKYSNRNLKW